MPSLQICRMLLQNIWEAFFIVLETVVRGCFFKKAILKNFVKFTGKDQYWSHFWIKLQI